MRKLLPALLLLMLACALPVAAPSGAATGKLQGSRTAVPGVTGSSGCRSCHEKFYQLWSTSFHGLAMRPYSDALARSGLTPQDEAIPVGQARYRAFVGQGQGWVEEESGGTTRKYPITQVLGGKNVFYFLTPLEKGRLQTLPVAYDVRRRQWFDMAGSGVRHTQGSNAQALHWKDWPYTFNTACHGCHVSQLSTNYDAASDTYRTTWVEPGINCETCHGPGGEHAAVCQAAPKGRPPRDLKTIRGGRDFTAAQNNDLCSTCHAKAVPLTAGLKPGERFFDHFDLAVYDNPDYHPDGRDLGENYTFTSWSRSPCARAGGLDCLHCHTTSGRYKFTDEARANDACLPCHAARVAGAAEHSRHAASSPGSRCVSCHMPMTEFARMRRSDHSMLPPTPAATMAFNSPNACNICHADKDAAWADGHVRSWRQRDYQAPVLRSAGLVDAARRGDWSRLADTLEYLRGEKPDPIVAASLVRLLQSCPDHAKWEALTRALTSPSPLVRASAAQALTPPPSPEAAKALAAATADEYRLVRVKAASALSGLPRGAFPLDAATAKSVEEATREYLASLGIRPDLWTSQYNLGNFRMSLGDTKGAVACFEAASRMDPGGVPPLVNASIAYSRLGENAKAEAALDAALRLDPDDAPANFNMGLLKAELGDKTAAERHLRTALRASPGMAEAAFNLGVLISANRPGEALALCSKAAGLRPDVPRYAYTQAFMLARSGDRTGAAQVLRALLASHPGHQDAARLLAELQRTGL